jgi:arabinose-5-phosphate isomerase
MRVESLMHAGKHCPKVAESTRIRDVIYEMSSKGKGMTCVVGDDDELLGIITDGDLRRHMDRASNLLELTAADIMTRTPVAVPPSMLAAEALNVMEQRKITVLVIADGRPPRVGGVVHLHDLWRTELV